MKRPGTKDTIILATDQLRPGMYVSFLEQPDGEGDHPGGGFQITSEEQIQRLRQTCEFVYVRRAPDDPLLVSARHTHREFFEQRALARPRPGLKELRGKARYVLAHDTEFEIEAAREALRDFRKAVAGAFRAVKKGASLELQTLETCGNALTDSILRNPDAALYLIRTDRSGEARYRHATSCAIMAGAMGRHLGLERPLLDALVCGGALLDLGMMRLPAELATGTDTVSMSTGEMFEFRRHVLYGIDLLLEAAPQQRDWIEMVASHHERFGGSGYPEGLEGDRICLLSQIAGLVDMFGTLVGQESAGRRATPYEAMRFLKGRSGKDFDPELIREFNQAFGTYPTGTLVELDNGSVAFVIQQSQRALITPRVKLVMDGSRQRLHEFKVLDLDTSGQLTARPGPCIRSCLESGSHGIKY